MDAAARDAQRAETMRTLERIALLPEGDLERERLRDEVITDHMAYARHIAQRYARSGSPLEDLEQVAYVGLVKAVDNFDVRRGRGFLPYATPMIVGEIKRHFRDATWDVHVPRRMQELTAALRGGIEALNARLGRPPEVAELAEHLGVDAEEIVDAFDAAEAYTTSSLDRPVGSGPDAAALGELIGEHDPGFDAAVDREVLKSRVSGLSDRDKRILLMRYFRGMTQVEIGERIGVSQMQVSRLLARILAHLREGFEFRDDPEPDPRSPRGHIPPGTG